MNIDGRFFGTSDGAGGGDPRGGAGWLDDDAPDASSSVYKPYHVLPSVVNDPALVDGLSVGDTVEVTYTTSAGVLTARAVTVTGSPPSNNGTYGSDSSGSAWEGGN